MTEPTPSVVELTGRIAELDEKLRELRAEYAEIDRARRNASNSLNAVEVEMRRAHQQLTRALGLERNEVAVG